MMHTHHKEQRESTALLDQVEALKERNARLVLQLGRLAQRIHVEHDHVALTFRRCESPYCQTIADVIDRNQDPPINLKPRP